VALFSPTSSGRVRLGKDESEPIEGVEMTEIVEYKQSDSDKVASWRLHQLMEAGYPVHLAERLAQSDADLHRAIELVRQGCDATVAAEILL
jgi:hypothetical protein